MDLSSLAQRGVHRVLTLKGARSFFTQLKGHTVHTYEAWSTAHGPPLVLVHGLASSAQGFAKVLLPLSKHFPRVLALDLPGSGFSPNPASGPLTLDEQVDVLVAFCREVVTVPCLLVGNSLGGAFCLKLASEHPELVSALALIAPAGAQLDEQRLAEVFQLFHIHSTADVRRMMRRLFHGTPYTALLLAPLLLSHYQTDTLKTFLERVSPSDALLPEVLKNVRAPTLLLWGKSDKLLPPESVDYFRTHLPPRARIEIVPGFGHVPQMERPREVVARLARFAREVGV